MGLNFARVPRGYSIRPLTLSITPLLLLCLLPIRAFAECKDGSPPSYTDISSIMFERTGCGGFIHKPDDLKCSSYWVYFGKNFKTTYSQQDANVGRGGYVLDASMEDAQELLERRGFFSLMPPDTLVTDIAYSVLTVRRCNVVQRILMYPTVQTTVQTATGDRTLPIGGDAAVAVLFADFDALVARSKKEKVTDRPLYFDLNVFDPYRYVPAECGGTPNLQRSSA